MFFFSLVLQVTSTASDPELGFTIISCFISPNSNPSVASDYTLIQTVCPEDDSVKYYSQRDFPVPHTQTKKKNFSFTFNSKFNMSLLFLHCEMSLCSKRSQSNPRLPPVCSVIFSKLLLLLCMFYDFTVQAVKVFLVSQEVCSVSGVCFSEDFKSVCCCTICNLADLSRSVLGLHPKLKAENMTQCRVCQISSCRIKEASILSIIFIVFLLCYLSSSCINFHDFFFGTFLPEVVAWG